MPHQPFAFTIRPITADDEPFLWEMLYLAIHIPDGVPPLPRDIVLQPELAKYVQGWGRAGDEGLIALETGSNLPIGGAWLRFFTAENPSYGYISDEIPELTMALLPDFRGKGVGTKLLNDLLAAATSAISLSVDPGNAAMVLYERFGFKTVGASGTSVTMLRPV